MKKTAGFTLFTILTFAAASGYCDATTVGACPTGPDAARHAHRAELIAKRKANPASANAENTRAASGEESHAAKFWKNEGERSGVSKWSVPNLNPVPWFQEQDRKYKERKAAGSK